VAHPGPGSAVVRGLGRELRWPPRDLARAHDASAARWRSPYRRGEEAGM